MVQKQTRFAWDDLRIALAVAREGSVRSAARALGVSHSTVLRRIHELEEAASVRLFERKSERYELTPAGQDVFDTARELEEVVVALERRVEGRDQKLSGPIRVTLADPLLPALLPLFKRFSGDHPGIDISLYVGVGYLDLAHREADVALRISPAPPADLVGRRVVDIACGVYGSKRYLAGRKPKDLGALDWVGWPEDWPMAFARWTTEHVKTGRIALRVDSSWAVRDAVSADVGVALLPCVLGDAQPDWLRVKRIPEVSAPLWILTHRDLRATARVRVLRDFLWESLSRDRAAYEGRSRREP